MRTVKPPHGNEQHIVDERWFEPTTTLCGIAVRSPFKVVMPAEKAPPTCKRCLEIRARRDEEK
jgi:hypothetical protein